MRDTYPEEKPERRDDELREAMGHVRDVVAMGLQIRATNRLKVRQPLPGAVVVANRPAPGAHRFLDIVGEALSIHGNRPDELDTEESARGEGLLADLWRAGRAHLQVRPNMVIAAALERLPRASGPAARSSSR